jgi:hypothetical protein
VVVTEKKGPIVFWGTVKSIRYNVGTIAVLNVVILICCKVIKKGLINFDKTK